RDRRRLVGALAPPLRGLARRLLNPFGEPQFSQRISRPKGRLACPSVEGSAGRRRAGRRPWRAWTILALGLVLAIGFLVRLPFDADAHRWWPIVIDGCGALAGVAGIMRGRQLLRAPDPRR